jgi:aspartate/methionine/tyrosine aminotransferase
MDQGGRTIPEPFYTNYNGFSTTSGAVVVPCNFYNRKWFATSIADFEN